MKNTIANSFSLAAANYDRYAFIQNEIAERLLERLDYIKINPSSVLDLGCGTGTITNKLNSLFNNAKVIGLDLAPGMCKYANSQNKNTNIDFLCGDAENLPLENNSIDFIFSSCTIQWIDNLKNLFQEIHRVLTPNGLFLFSTLGPDTLMELANSWKNIDNYQHVNNFLDMHHIGDFLLQAKFSLPVVDQEHLTLTYTDLITLLKDLKGIGANIIKKEKFQGLYGKNTLKKLDSYYKNLYSNNNKMIPATYEVIYGIAWKDNITFKKIPNISIE